MLLAVDTATRIASIALYEPSQRTVLSEETWLSANRHTVELMPRIARMIETQGLAADDLNGLVIGLGPGSFTGLRIGMGVVKGLVLALDLPVVGIPTLDTLARPHMAQRYPIWALVQAGRGRYCAGYYVRHKGRWRRTGSYQLLPLDELCNLVKEAALFCGEIDHNDADHLQDRLGDKAILATPAASLRRAAFLAELGWERLSRGDSDDPATLAPIYLHHPQIDA